MVFYDDSIDRKDLLKIQSYYDYASKLPATAQPISEMKRSTRFIDGHRA